MENNFKINQIQPWIAIKKASSILHCGLSLLVSHIWRCDCTEILIKLWLHYFYTISSHCLLVLMNIFPFCQIFWNQVYHWIMCNCTDMCELIRLCLRTSNTWRKSSQPAVEGGVWIKFMAPPKISHIPCQIHILLNVHPHQILLPVRGDISLLFLKLLTIIGFGATLQEALTK